MLILRKLNIPKYWSRFAYKSTKMRYFISLFLLVISVSHVNGQNKKTILTVPGFNQLTKIDTANNTVLPSGRFISPAGKTLRITHDPFGLAISPDN